MMLLPPHRIGHPFVHAACTTILHSCSSLRPHTCLPALMCAPAALLCTRSGRSCTGPRRATRCVWEWMGACGLAL